MLFTQGHSRSFQRMTFVTTQKPLINNSTQNSNVVPRNPLTFTSLENSDTYQTQILHVRQSERTYLLHLVLFLSDSFDPLICRVFANQWKFGNLTVLFVKQQRAGQLLLVESSLDLIIRVTPPPPKKNGFSHLWIKNDRVGYPSINSGQGVKTLTLQVSVGDAGDSRSKLD